MRYPQYHPGAVWRCDQSKEGRYSFNFVVVGPGSKPDRKRCRIDYDSPNDTSRQSRESEYTHKHLKKYGVYQYTEIDCDWCDGDGYKCLVLGRATCHKCDGIGKVRLIP